MRVVVFYPYTNLEVCRPCHSEDGARCVSALMGLVTLTFDRLTLKLVCESHLNGEPSFQIWARVIRYVRDGRTDTRTDGQKRRLLPLLNGGGA